MLVMEDIDAPFKEPNLHMIAFFEPGICSLSEGILVAENESIKYIPDRKGRVEYQRPRPFPGHGKHNYLFHLYALNKTIDIDQKYVNFEQVLPLLNEHVVGRAHLKGIQIA
ncbi:hypothetical protein TVTCOM_18080 [Terrisporobacter vanillatitrophus]